MFRAVREESGLWSGRVITGDLKTRVDRVWDVFLVMFLPEGNADLCMSAATELHGCVAGINLENVLVRPHRRAVLHFAEWNPRAERHPPPGIVRIARWLPRWTLPVD